MKDISWESRPEQVSVRRTKQTGDACRGTAGWNLRWVRIVCWQLGDPGDGGREDLASSSLLSGSLPRGSPERGRASPFSGEPPTGEPYAGEPHVRFGGRRGRVLNRLFLPLSRSSGEFRRHSQTWAASPHRPSFVAHTGAARLAAATCVSPLDGHAAESPVGSFVTAPGLGSCAAFTR